MVSAAAPVPGPDADWPLPAPEPGTAGTASGTPPVPRSSTGSRASRGPPGPDRRGCAFCGQAAGGAPDPASATLRDASARRELGCAVVAGSAAAVAGAGAAGSTARAAGSGVMPVSASASGSTKRPEAGKSPDAMGMTARTDPAAVPSTSSTAAAARSVGALEGTTVTAGTEETIRSTGPGGMPKTGDNSPELSPPEPGGGDWRAAGGAEGATAESVESKLPESSSRAGPVSALAVVAESASQTAAAAPPSNTGRSRREARPDSRSFFTCNTPQVRRSTRDE